MSFGFSISDFVAVLRLANDIGKQFVDARIQFKAICKEVESFSTVLRDIDDVLPGADSLGDSQYGLPLADVEHRSRYRSYGAMTSTALQNPIDGNHASSRSSCTRHDQDGLTTCSNGPSWGLQAGEYQKLETCRGEVSGFYDNENICKMTPRTVENMCRFRDGSISDLRRYSKTALDSGDIRGHSRSLIMRRLIDRIEEFLEPEGRSPEPEDEGDLMRQMSSTGRLSDLPETNSLNDGSLRKVQVSGQQLRSLSTLDAPFHALRNHCDNRVVCVDSLCVKQQDAYKKPSQVQAKAEVHEVHETVSQDPKPNTCGSALREVETPWIFKCTEYMKWRDQKDGCFLLSGSSGTGKSTLMNSIAGDLAANRRGGELVIAYEVDNDKRTGSPSTEILGEILIELLFSPRSRKSRQGLECLFKELILSEKSLSASGMEEILSQIRHSLNRDENLCVLVDGVDEWGHNVEEQSLFFGLIDQLCRCNPSHHIKCFVSAKPTFGRSLRYDYRVNIDAHASNNENLEVYVNKIVLENFANHAQLAADSFAKLISERANGVFLWARLVMDDRLSTNAERENHHLGSVGLINTYSLSSLYDKLFDRIQLCDQNAALSMLRWITYAMRPLHVNELLGALHAETGIDLAGANIIEMCAGLIRLEDNGMVRLIHSSVREYLANRMKHDWLEISNEAHEIIAHACLRSMTSEVLLKSLRFCPQAQGMSASLETLQFESSAFENYCCQFWLYHYRLAESSSTFLAGVFHDALQTSLRGPQTFYFTDCDDYNDGIESSVHSKVKYETKARLQKVEVDILEREFVRNPKPTTETKRRFAEEMEIDLARINNWFQNRRAKAKQLMKQQAYEVDHSYAPLQYDSHYHDPPRTRMGSVCKTTVVDQAASSDDHLSVALLVAARFGFPKLLKLELEMGACVDLISGEACLTPLMWAAMSDNCEVVQTLLQYGANPHIANRSGYIPLTYAIANGHIKTVKLLRDEHMPTEDFTIEVSASTPCHNCGASETMYKFAPCTPETSQADDVQNYPAIFVKGGTVLPAECLRTTSTTTFKWLAGPQMHRALAMAAKLGIEIFRALLFAMGNDTHVLQGITSISAGFKHEGLVRYGFSLGPGRLRASIQV